LPALQYVLVAFGTLRAALRRAAGGTESYPQRNKVEREEKKWAADHPILAWAEAVHTEEGATEEKRDRSVRPCLLIA
jgi:hypothetical protein